jgi:hypothetical protein
MVERSVFSPFMLRVAESSVTHSTGDEVETIVKLGSGGGEIISKKLFAVSCFGEPPWNPSSLKERSMTPVCVDGITNGTEHL